MAEQYLMKRGTSENMNVPGSKLQEYLDDGWTVVEKNYVDAAESGQTAKQAPKPNETAKEKKERLAREKAEQEAAEQESAGEEDPQE
jgi:hypothetical protein